MGEITSDNDLDVFKEAIMDDNISIQVDAMRRLPLLASAIDVERTREELMPYLANCVDAMPEELLYNLAEQLEIFTPFVGGNEYAGAILEILIKLAKEDELIVRDRAITAMKTICDNLTNDQCEKSFAPLIDTLIGNDWFTSKCSASYLITISYMKMPQEKQAELRNVFRNLIQDDLPMVRCSTATNLIDFIACLNLEIIKAEFVPIFDNLAQDEQDFIRISAVDIGVAIAHKMRDFEILEYLLKTFKLLSTDASWRVRQRIAMKIHEIPTCDKIREEMLKIYKNCVRDDEGEVRVFAATNLYNFSRNLWENFKDQSETFEKYFETNITPEIHFMITDISNDVRVALSSNILSLSSILKNDNFNEHILPLVISALENEEHMTFKENMLKNLNSLPANVDITKSFQSIQNVIKNLLDNSQMHWRTRRHLLLAFAHIIRHITSEFFDENLKSFYAHLLSDHIFAIRRTAPTLLPLLIKQFGMSWAKTSLIPIFLFFAQDDRYLFRYTTLYGVNELIKPTVDQNSNNNKYLLDFKYFFQSEQSKKIIKRFAKIVRLNERLGKKLECEIVEDEGCDYKDNIKFYGEDTVDTLTKEQSFKVFSLTVEVIKHDDIYYLEGVLQILIEDFVNVIKDLMKDSMINVQDKAKATWRNIQKFSNAIQEETKDSWVEEILRQLTEEEMKKIDDELEKYVEKANTFVTNEDINCEMAEPEIVQKPGEEKNSELKSCEEKTSEIKNGGENE